MCVVLDAILLLVFIILKCRARVLEKRRVRRADRKMAGINIGTIAESSRSRKLAQFVTLDDVCSIDEDDKSEIFTRKGIFSASYWKKRFKMLKYILKDIFSMETFSGKDLDFQENTNIIHMSFDDQNDLDYMDGNPFYQSQTQVPHTRSRASTVVSDKPDIENVASEANVVSIRRRRGGSVKSKRGPHLGKHGHYSIYMQQLIDGFSHSQCGNNLSLNFEFKDLSLTLPSGKIILNSVTGRVIPGRITAVLGPSGAGKSTFLSVLMGKSRRTGGHLWINGREIEMRKYKKLIGYVPQDDIMLYELTVRENVWYQARNRLPSTWSEKEVHRFVDSVLEALELSHVAENVISKISGGQRKRCSVAMEIATCPLALLLDEPTSGLDATAALKLVHIVKKITQTIGITAISVIHQPRYEIYENFDDVLLLATGGSSVFLGPREHLQEYMENLGFYFPPNNNPADVIMDILAGKGLRIPEYLRGEKDLPKLLKENNVVFDDYEVSDLTEFWKQSGLEYYDPSVNLFKHDLIPTVEEVEDLEMDLSEIVVTQQHELSEFAISVETKDEAQPDQSFWQLTQGRVAFNMLPTIISNSFYSAPVKEEDESVISSHNALDCACKSRGINFLHQSFLAHNRYVRQQYRLITGLLLELAVATIAGNVVGMAVQMYDGALYRGFLIKPFTLISPAPIEIVVPILCLIQYTVIVLAGAPAGVKVFGEEKQMYWHERAAGLNPLSYFIGKNISSTYRFVLSALHFTSFFMFWACPNINFWKMYIIHLSVFFAVYGMAFLCSMIVKRENSAMIAVCLGVIMAVLCGGGPNITDMRKAGLEWLLNISFCRWAAEAWYSEELLVFDGVFEIWDISAATFGYTLGRYWYDIMWCVVIGFVYRFLAFILMICMNRSKQQ